MNDQQKRLEALGPAERVVQTLSTFTDHLFHNRPGLVTAAPASAIGVRWEQVLWRKQEDGSKHVFRPTKVGKKVTETLVGVLGNDGQVRSNGRIVGRYQHPGIFPEVAAYLYRQIAAVYKLDHAFVAHWGSWAFAQDRRDLKTVLAAFLLCQERKGDPVLDGGEVLFRDEDYRAIGEAMLLLQQKGIDFNARQLLQVAQVLTLPQVHAINRELGFSKSERNPLVRRYQHAIRAWLKQRETNPKMLQGLVKAGLKSQVRELAQISRYKPQSAKFYETLRWKQKQTSDGRRVIGLDLRFAVAETWEGLSEAQICEKIVQDKPAWLSLSARLPASVGVTRAIFAAAVEAGSLSDKELILLTPTIEELGLLNVEPVASRWKAACQRASDQRAANIARNVKSDKVKEELQAAADVATAKAIEKVTKDLRIYVMIDKSGSMEKALAAAKRCLGKFLGGFPLERCHVSVFNTMGSEVVIQQPRAAAVEAAFRGHGAGGGTSYSEGVRALQNKKPLDSEDVLFIFVGDEEGEAGVYLGQAITQSGLRPNALASLFFGNGGRTVADAAAHLKIPYFRIEEALFDDPYSVTQTLTNLIASTPVRQGAPAAQAPARVTLVEQILKTPLLVPPAWL